MSIFLTSKEVYKISFFNQLSFEKKMNEKYGGSDYESWNDDDKKRWLKLSLLRMELELKILGFILYEVPWSELYKFGIVYLSIDDYGISINW